MFCLDKLMCVSVRAQTDSPILACAFRHIKGSSITLYTGLRIGPFYSQNHRGNVARSYLEIGLRPELEKRAL